MLYSDLIYYQNDNNKSKFVTVGHDEGEAIHVTTLRRQGFINIMQYRGRIRKQRDHKGVKTKLITNRN